VIVDWVTYKIVTGDTFSLQADAEAALARAQTKAEEIAERLFDKAERTETLPADDQGKVWPKAYPIASVSVPTNAALADGGQSISVAGDTTWWTNLWAGSQLATRPRFAVTYIGGYDATTPAPTGLQDAICELAHRYRNPADTTTLPAGARAVGATGQSASGGRLGGSGQVPPELRDTIRQYRHVAARLP
jgi:hypothetical protein